MLRAARDEQAQVVLEQSHKLLQEQATKIGDLEMREMFLENVPSHRELVAAWQVLQDGG